MSSTVAHVVDADRLPARSATEVQGKWGHVVREVREKGRVAITSRGYADMVLLSRAEYDRMMQALAQPAQAGPDPVAELTRRFEERFQRMRDGSMAAKVERLLDFQGRMDNPPIAGESY